MKSPKEMTNRELADRLIVKLYPGLAEMTTKAELLVEAVRRLANANHDAMVIDRIKRETARAHQVAVECLEGTRRRQNLVAARSEAMVRCVAETQATLEYIGGAFNRNHSTVLHAMRKQGYDSVYRLRQLPSGGGSRR